jgi:hypothetical protein
VHAGLAYAYATLWFTTPFFVLSVALSVIYIFAWRGVARAGRRPERDPRTRPRAIGRSYFS